MVLADAITSNHSVADVVLAGSGGSVKWWSAESIGELTLYTHNYRDKTALALNEIADWYYERVQ